MNAQQQANILSEIAGQLAPETAHKLRIMFSHLGQRSIDDMNELMLRNFLMTAAILIDRYRLVGDDFNASQRALLAAETYEEIWRDKTQH